MTGSPSSGSPHDYHNIASQRISDEIDDSVWHSDLESEIDETYAADEGDFDGIVDNGEDEDDRTSQDIGLSGDEGEGGYDEEGMVCDNPELGLDEGKDMLSALQFEESNIGLEPDDDDELIVTEVVEEIVKPKKGRRRGKREYAEMSGQERENLKAKKARRARERAAVGGVGVHHRKNARAKERKKELRKVVGLHQLTAPPRILLRLKNTTVISSSLNATDLEAAKGAYQGIHRPVQPDDRCWTVEGLLKDGLEYIEWDGR